MGVREERLKLRGAGVGRLERLRLRGAGVGRLASYVPNSRSLVHTSRHSGLGLMLCRLSFVGRLGRCIGDVSATNQSAWQSAVSFVACAGLSMLSVMLWTPTEQGDPHPHVADSRQWLDVFNLP